jgi:hypothetical protein
MTNMYCAMFKCIEQCLNVERNDQNVVRDEQYALRNV